MTKFPFKCPKCDALSQQHGKGTCISRRGMCEGLICECFGDDYPDSEAIDHGESFTNPCTNANCCHCGWGGTVPMKPKGMQAWEKKALEAGWTMPESREKELKP